MVRTVRNALHKTVKNVIKKQVTVWPVRVELLEDIKALQIQI